MLSMPQAAPASLAVAVAAVPDPRRQASVRYPLPALLALTVSALLAGQHSVLAIAEWGACQPTAVLRRLGFASGQTPCQSTLQRLFARLDVTALAHALTAHFAPSAGQADTPHGISLDGKALRGQRQYRATGTPIDVLTAVCHATGIVLAQAPVAAEVVVAAAVVTKAQAELTVAPALLAQLDWTGRVFTGDALFCQRGVCQQVLDAGGDYLLPVKGNQPLLDRDIALLFDPPPSAAPPLPLLDRREARTIERGHGRQHEVRQLVASTDLTGYLDWPGVAQVFRLERTWQAGEQTNRQVQYGITSLPPDRGTPTTLLALKRGHWGIENRLHRVKDVTFGEDASLIHAGAGPLVLALVRDTAISLLYRAGIHQVAACLRRFSQQPHAALDLVLRPPPTHA